VVDKDILKHVEIMTNCV